MTEQPRQPIDDIEQAAHIVEAFTAGHPDAAGLLCEIAQAIRDRAFDD